jgi:hypothetical protein
VEYKEVKAAQGVKIAAKDLEKVIAGQLPFDFFHLFYFILSNTYGFFTFVLTIQV